MQAIPVQLLALDIGTTSLRGILYDAAGHELAVESVATPLLIDNDRGTIEQSPQVIIEAITRVCSRIAATFTIDAIAITAFRSAPTLVDKTGRALRNFIMWQDTRNAEICTRLKYADEQVYRTCGASINTVFTGTKITWFKEHEPELYNRASKVMIVPDYIINFMTGEFGTDATYGSRTLLMNIKSLQWDDEMCRLFSIDREKLCDIKPQGSIVGYTCKNFAKATGIKTGVPVISAGGDQQCGALGQGVLDSSTIEVNSGTGAFVISLVNRPVLENQAVICNVSSIPGMYTQEMNIIATASAVNWLLREVFPEYWGGSPTSPNTNYETINRLAAETPMGSHGLLCVPHFQGCGSRDWRPDAAAGFWGTTLGTTRGDMIRSLYEGLACEIAKSIDSLPDSCREADSIAVSGGLSNSDIYLQILADVANKKLVRSPTSQATARGAFISATVALGVHENYSAAYQAVHKGESAQEFSPDTERAEFYVKVKEATELLYRAGLTARALVCR